MRDAEAEPVPERMSRDERLHSYLTSGLNTLNEMLNDVENGMDDVHLDLSRNVDLERLIGVRSESGLRTNFKELTQRLIEWFEKLASKLTVDKPHLLMYSILDENGKRQWKNIYLTPYNLNVIINDLKENGIFTEGEENFSGLSSDSEEYEIPTLAVMKNFLICPLEARYGTIKNLAAVQASAESHKIKRVYTNRENAFFPYYPKDDKLPKNILDYLEQRLQIINHKTDTKEVLKDCCAIYALRVAGVEEDTLNLIKGTRLVNDRNLKFGDLRKVCDEFKLNVAIRDCDAETVGNKNKVRISTKYKEGKQIVLCAFKGHYFLEEVTPFSLDNIRHVAEYFESGDFDGNLGKRFRHGKWVNDNSRKNLVSHDIVKILFDLGYFKEMTFQDMMKYPQVINTISNDQLKIKKNGQEFKACFKSAEELGLNKHINSEEDDDDDEEETEEEEKMIWYADFETDTHKRGETHKHLYTVAHEPFLVCLHNQDGTVKKEFEGVNCGKQLMDFLPNNSLV